MKRTAVLILACLCAVMLWTGCRNSKEEAEPVSIANPWSDWASMAEAETAVGFAFGLPEEIAGRYTADAFRTMNGELMEVIYRDGDTEIRVRKQKGEGQDISGDYNTYDICTEEHVAGGTVTTYQNSGSNGVKQVISCEGFSWSITAPEGFTGDDNQDFVSSILG